MNYHNFEELLGKTFSKVFKQEDEIVFLCSSGDRYILRHEQDCCEHVYIESIVGDLTDLVNSEILIASESYTKGDVSGVDSYTHTFYKLATIKGYVDIRFYGESNGYYSESVTLFKE